MPTIKIIKIKTRNKIKILILKRDMALLIMVFSYILAQLQLESLPNN